MREAVALFRAFLFGPIARVAVENPIMHGEAARLIGQRQAQTIQPYQFGDDASKRTCLWLRGLPRLIVPHEEAWIVPRMVAGLPRWGNQTDSGQNKLSPSADRWKLRSETYQGIARAMAHQWGGTVIQK